VPGGDATTPDVYLITLDRKLNTEPDYVLGTFFWHVDGVTMDMALPKATVLSARTLSHEGGATEFANLYAAYEALSDEEKAQIENLRVIHHVRRVFVQFLAFRRRNASSAIGTSPPRWSSL